MPAGTEGANRPRKLPERRQGMPAGRTLAPAASLPAEGSGAAGGRVAGSRNRGSGDGTGEGSRKAPDRRTGTTPRDSNSMSKPILST